MGKAEAAAALSMGERVWIEGAGRWHTAQVCDPLDSGAPALVTSCNLMAG